MARVLIVDDHPAVRLGLLAEISREHALTVVEVEDRGRARELAAALRPDAVLVGLTPADEENVVPLRQMVTVCTQAGVIGLSSGRSASWARAAMGVGARGCVAKASPVATVCEAVRVVLSGQVYVDPAFGISAPAVGPLRKRAVALSARESDVLRLCAKGLSRLIIADQLGLSPRTVETFKARAMAKLALSSRAELMRFAARSGWLDE